MKRNERKLPGLLLALLLAVPAWIAGIQFPFPGGPVIGIMAGMVLATRWTIPASTDHGLTFVSRRFLQAAIILIGFGMDMSYVAAVGAESLSLIVLVILVAFVAAFIGGRALQNPYRTSLLIGIGTGICGGSAIAAAAPVVEANEKEVASAISTIFFFNVVAVLLFPPAGRLLGMTDTVFGIWAGTAINDTSSVVAAGQLWSQQALETATVVKLVRTLMLIPVVVLIAWLERSRKAQVTNKVARKVPFSGVIPWFVLLFLASSAAATGGIVSGQMSTWTAAIGKFCVVAAMSAIGLKTDIRELFSFGRRSMILGCACWMAVVMTSLLFQWMTAG